MWGSLAAMRGSFVLSALVALVISVGCGAPPASEAIEQRGADVDASLDAAPWLARLSLERTLAEEDTRHQPRPIEGGVVLAPNGLSTLVAADGAHVAVRHASARIGVTAVGREQATLPIEAAAPSVVGSEVRRELADGVTEWWRSLNIGLEHGVTLAKRPEGTGPLLIDVGVDGVTPRTDANTNSVAFTVGESDAQVADYAHLLVLDAGGSIVPAQMSVTGSVVRIEVDDSQATYPLIVDPLVVAVEDSIVAAVAVAGDEFGTSVAISADGTRAVVGAPNDAYNDSTSWYHPGTARVYLLTAGSWNEEQVLWPAELENLFDNHQFGHAVAMSSDGSRVIVSSPRSCMGLPTFCTVDTDPDSSGRAYIFVRSGTTWSLEDTLLASSPAAKDLFGWSVSMTAAGDRVIVGARDNTAVAGTEAGGAFIFVRSVSTWSLEQELIPTDAESYERFGVSAAISPDGTRAIVGARLDSVVDDADTWEGSARVFLRSASTWTQETTLRASTPVSFSQLGWSVALDNDATRAVVGHVFHTEGAAFQSGAARVFLRTGTSWAEEAELLMTGGASGDQFGISVGVSSDGSRVVVGAYFDDSATLTASGSARVFERTGTSWANETTLVSPAEGAEDHFGTSVSMTAAGTRVIVGAPHEEPSGGGLTDNQGGAHVFTVGSLLSANGVSCTLGSECTSNNCIDGVCCESSCGSGSTSDCQSCLASATGATDGLCRAILSGTECRAAVGGGCDVAETCDGAATACPSDGFASGSTVCRVAVSTCDAAETCTGSSSVCPTDGFASGSTVCRVAATMCDVAETCTGSSSVCPTDGFASGSTVCRVAASTCDAAETCTGSSSVCPTDGFASSSTVCRMAVSTCDATETCTGSSSVCPTDGFASGSTVCRAAVSTCDAAETCTGSSNACPADVLASSGTVCRAATGLCDAAETCTGASNTCPVDVVLPGGTVCRDVAGGCDVAETCNGSTADCPFDGYAGSSLICRSSLGDCDPAESCTGSSTACPPNVFHGTSTVCRAATGVCDVSEVCSGIAPSCPSDGFAADGTACADALVCNGDEVCSSGSCAMATALSCDDANLCTSDMCSEPSGCSSVPVADCCNIDGDCDDSNACTVNTCSGPGGACGSSPITGCCLADGDCDDMNVCTAETCDLSTNRCSVTPVAGCCSTDTDCNDSNACTADTCDVASGACTNSAIADCCLTDGDCDDTNTCTMDACDLATNTCTNDLLAGCCLTDAECADTNVCTADSCDAATATCANDPIADCCVDDTECDDADACTTNRCDSGTSMCVYEPIMGCGETDAGVPDAGVDAGRPDSGPVTPVDGGDVDAGTPDASSVDAGPDMPSPDCGCHAQSSRPAPLGWLMLLGTLGLFWRRRR